MRRIVLALVGLASLYWSAPADAAPARARPVFAPNYSWTGFYVGAHIGGGWLDHHRHDTANSASFANHDPASFLGGGQVGYNHQIGAWVWGIEAQVSGADFTQETPASVPAFAALGFTKFTRVDMLGTVAGRLGYAWANWLAYVKGGWAFADYRYEIRLNGALSSAVGDDRSGWMIGFGVENQFSGNWSWKIEYNYMDFGSATHTFAEVVPEVWQVDDQIHVVKLGVNYRFTGWPR
jgi:outer membrane immunogenic protein